MRVLDNLNQAVTRELSLHFPRLPLHRSQLRWTLYLGDLLLVNLAALISLGLGLQRSRWWLAVLSWDTFVLWFVFLSLLWWLLAQVNDLYDLRMAGRADRVLVAALQVVASVVGVYLILYFFAAPQSLPRHLIVFFALTVAVLISLWRWSFAMALSALPFRRRILLVGDGEGARVLLQVIKENAVNHYEIVGWVSGTGEDALREERIVHLTGSVQQLPEVVARERVDELGLALSDGLDESMLEVLTVCREQGLQITTMTDLYEQLTGRVPVEHVGKEWFVALPWDQESARGFSGIAKRILDVALAVAGLVVSAPLWLIIMSAIRLDSSGSIFYHQPRVGKNGCIFDLIKFRTMVANAEEPGQPVWAARQDPRITRVGRVLRRLRLDELPQFVNVLKGEMSLVGPRPERPELVSTLEKQIPFYRMRHTVRPGVTGWAAIHFGYGRSVEDALVKLQYDLYYIKHQSLYLDLLILAKTLGAVLVLPDRGG